MYKNGIKRLLDIVLSGIGIIVFGPIMLLIAIVIKLDSPGPILFKQKRVGIHKSYFSILKFRTMRIDTPHDAPTHELSDPHKWITKVGRFLRKTSLDESVLSLTEKYANRVGCQKNQQCSQMAILLVFSYTAKKIKSTFFGFRWIYQKRCGIVCACQRRQVQ